MDPTTEANLAKSIESAAESLATLAAIRLADEFYTKEQRAELYENYAARQKAVTDAGEAMSAATAGAAIDQPKHNMLKIRKATAEKALISFEAKHPLIKKLHALKQAP
jgi:hypothetical protein